MKKKCMKCNITKEITEFYRHNRMSDGYLNKCKVCTKKDVAQNYYDNIHAKREYDRFRNRASKKRIFDNHYSNIKRRATIKATRTYGGYNKPYLSIKEYKEWLIDNMDDFEKLYKVWADNDYHRSLAPSIDRIDNSKGYIPNNMQWLSNKDNSLKRGRF